jgi:hypothetical protein
MFFRYLEFRNMEKQKSTNPIILGFVQHLQNPLQLEYLEVAVQEKLRSGWPGPFVKVEGVL